MSQTKSNAQGPKYFIYILELDDKPHTNKENQQCVAHRYRSIKPGFVIKLHCKTNQFSLHERFIY